MELEKFEMSRNFLKVAHMLDFWQKPHYVAKVRILINFSNKQDESFCFDWKSTGEKDLQYLAKRQVQPALHCR